MKTKPLSMTSEVARIRARAQAESAHQYAERCELKAFHDEERRDLARLRLNALVSRLTELTRELALLEREILDIADVLAT